MRRYIGGFFEKESVSGTCAITTADKWQLNDHSRYYYNARSALHYLLKHLSPPRTWLPAYCCDALAEATKGLGTTLHFYPVSEALTPNITYIKNHVHAGDAVVAIDYFGRPPAREFQDFVKQHPDIYWIEDRAQALDTQAQPWGEYVLYSPRKLFGVSDGGIITGKHALPAPQHVALPIELHKNPAHLRAEDSAETQNHVWYPRYLEAENSMHVGNTAMSTESKNLIYSIDIEAMAHKRRSNYMQLDEALSAFSLLGIINTDFAPMCFAMRSHKQREIITHLHKHQVFAAHHWASMPSSATEFPSEHALASEEISLPCDHRYGAEEMKRIISLVSEVL